MEKFVNNQIFKTAFKHFPLTFVLLFALILRLWWLDKFPVGITYDEAEYILDAKAIFHTGKDISGLWSPLSLTTKPLGVLTAELPALIISPLIGPVKLSLLTARLPYVFFSTLLILLVYLISRELLKSRRIAILAALLLSVNPWSFHFGRTAFEAPLAVLFYLIAVYTLLKTHSWKILLSFPFLFLGFFSYLGTKLILLPLVFVVCFFHYFCGEQKTSKKPYLVLILLSILLVFYYVLSLKHQPAGIRMNDLLFATDKIAQAVNTERRLSLPNSLIVFFSNKATYFFKKFITNYLSVFSIKHLFLFGEERGAYSVWIHGLFYYIDLIFILAGVYFLLTTNKNQWLFLISLMAIAPLPVALGVDYETYVFRSVLLFPILIIFAAIGITYVIKRLNRYRQLISFGVIIIYFLLVLNYLYLYFFRYPVYGAEGFFFSGRVLSKYISLHLQNPEKKIIVISPEAEGLFKQHLFYSGLFNQENNNEIADSIRKEDFRIRNVSFTDICPREDILRDEHLILIYRRGSKCEKEIERLMSLGDFSQQKRSALRLSISSLADGGEIYRIYGDRLCFRYDLGIFPRVTSINDFQVEGEDVESFCKKWIMDLSQIEQSSDSEQ